MSIESDCFDIGISGRCGLDCHVYLSGHCSEPDEFLSGTMAPQEIELHLELYPAIVLFPLPSPFWVEIEMQKTKIEKYGIEIEFGEG